MRTSNNEQRLAYSHTEGAACVIAGAGTGKTTTLVDRIGFLVTKKKLSPQRILVTTFTRKATVELYERVCHDIGEEQARQLHVTTIDALIWDLGKEAMRSGLMRPGQLIGEANQRLLLLDSAWEEFGVCGPLSRRSWSENAKEIGLIDLLERGHRAALASGREKKELNKSIRDSTARPGENYDGGFRREVPTTTEVKRAVSRYFRRLKELRWTDYGLFSRDFLQCLKKHKKLLKQYIARFDAILVDEFQDTSKAQAEILVLLAGRHRHIWVVGDPCQQIYEWRGASRESLRWFIKTTKARKYYLTGNRRSTQKILDSAYAFLLSRVPSLKKDRMLIHLTSLRDADFGAPYRRHPVYTAKLDQALSFVRGYLDRNPHIRPSDVALLSRRLDEKTVKEIKRKARHHGLRVQFNSSRADFAMEDILTVPPWWRPGRVLRNLYKHPQVQRIIGQALRRKDFNELRTIRSLATAAEALDSTLSREGFSFYEAWPALSKIQDREVAVSTAVTERSTAIQVMTIHAAKGLEFPVVLLMKLGNGGPNSFPYRHDPEASRLVYVGATRARDILVLVHTETKPKETLSTFGPTLAPLYKNSPVLADSITQAPQIRSSLPLIAATHLDLYEQCPLKFAAYHEGRLLPEWSLPQSIGARMHKALEYYLLAGMPAKVGSWNECFKRGFKDGDSPLRNLPNEKQHEMKKAYQRIIKDIKENSAEALLVEHRYRYLLRGVGQVEGVIDAVLRKKDGANVLKEWKSAGDIKGDTRQQYDLQARVGALGLMAQDSYQIHRVEIVPIFDPSSTRSMPNDSTLKESTLQLLERVFENLRDRRYEPRRGSHCKSCQLKSQCPASHKR